MGFEALHARVAWALMRVGIFKIEQLEQMPDENLLKIKYIGRAALKEIRQIAPKKPQDEEAGNG